MSRKLVFAKEEYYHLYNRGVDKRVIFENDSDYKRFSLLLYLCNKSKPVQFDHLPEWRGSTSPELISAVFKEQPENSLVSIGAYCLMPNHFHLLVKEIRDKGLSTFMQRVSTAYTMYFNSSRERSGALFQGRFKAEHAKTDRYLKYLFSYIHLNPAKIVEPHWKEKDVLNREKVKEYLTSFPYSSYMDYMEVKREFSKILHRKNFPDYFPTKVEFETEIKDWLSYNHEE